ncbi:MAG: peptide chain release factor 2 [Ferrimicrobium sp.]
MSEPIDRLKELGERVCSAARYLRQEEIAKELEALEAELAESSLWDVPDRAREVSRRYTVVKDDLDLLNLLSHTLEEAEVLAEFLSSGESEFADEFDALTHSLGVRLDELEIRSLLSGEFDEGDAVAEIHSGVGGTDAQDWAEMMLRMFERYSITKGFDFELDEVTPGQEAGILSATFIVKGRYAYGLLRAERGVHRLVRISPFDGQHRRQTSFASFDVTPFLEDSSDTLEIDEKELRIDTFRSSGAGGQHVNVTDSAVRITHLPTGIVVSCQNERSQLQNKTRALQILRAKLRQRQSEEFRAQMDAIGGPQSEVGWASQIRSYVLAPYQLVKDHRSLHEERNVQAVLDGELDPFIQAFLEWRRREDPTSGADA